MNVLPNKLRVVTLGNEVHFRFCPKCGGLLELEEDCVICDKLEEYDPKQAQKEIKFLFFPSPQQEANNLGETLKIKLEHSLIQTSKEDENISHFLRVEHGDTYIWYPCRECNGKFREIIVLTLDREKREKPSMLYSDCDHYFEEKLPLDLIEKIEKKLKYEQKKVLRN